MAWTLSALLLFLLAVSITVTPATGQGVTCEAIDRCSETFSSQAQGIGHDQERFCQLLTEEIQCFLGTINYCPQDTKDFAQGKVRHSQREREQACDASQTMSSFVLLGMGTTLAILQSRWLS
ncbi:uncharacterized protein [Littorina saxatilis]|uniref:Uncharacterized protein n=1 Tax=Littorina saxatilis TaxID=31220 RepID=A0AAN9B8V8_9CAEN